MSTFEVLASEDAMEQERLAGTRAVIAAQSRSKEQFGAFVEKASNDIERDARISVISGDLDAVLAEVASEYGYDDIERLRNAATVALGAGHASDCTCGFCENKGKLPGTGENDADKGRAEEERAETIDAETKESKTASVCTECHHPMDKHSADGTSEGDGKGCQLCDCSRTLVKDEGAAAGLKGSSVSPRVYPEYDWEHTAAGAEPEDGDSYQKERINVESGPSASPKIDKSRVPEDGLKPIDVNSERHQLEHQDVTDRAKYNDSDFDPVNNVTDRIDADKPLQPEFTKADGTEQWTGTEGQATPVTSNLAKWSVLT